MCKPPHSLRAGCSLSAWAGAGASLGSALGFPLGEAHSSAPPDAVVSDGAVL